MNEIIAGKVYFIGAGPGDAELITVKGQKLLAAADIVLYAGSLVAPEILKYTSANATLYNSAGMKLDDQISLLVEAARQGKHTVRLHTGDPSIFGAIDEQMLALRDAGVSYEVIPGVSSVFAAAAALGIEFTLPEITQTLILTRMNDRTPVPELERLRDLASHHSSLAIVLSTGLIVSVVEELLSAGYPIDTPIAVVYRASWPDQNVVIGTLSEIATRLDQQELTHQGMIIVSPALRSERISTSHLYGKFQQVVSTKSGTAILTLTVPAVKLGRVLSRSLPDAHLYIPERFLAVDDHAQVNVHGFHESIRQVLQDTFQHYEALVCIMASGIVVRELAPMMKNKHSDPAVVVMDPSGKYAVSLLSGHEGGANQLAHRLAAMTGGQAVITTASDHEEIPALDILAKDHGWKMVEKSKLARVIAALINGEAVGLVRDENASLPGEILSFRWATKFLRWEDALSSGYKHLVVLTYQALPLSFWQTFPDSIVYHLPILILGIGCNRGTPYEEILAAIQETLDKSHLAIESVAYVATITEKADEAGLIELCHTLKWKMSVFTHEQIQHVKNIPNPSGYAQKYLGVPGVAEPAALLASGASALLVEKQKFPNVTVAVALKENTYYV